MKIERLFIYCLLAGTFLLASCSNEDVTDNPIVETLPEGMYPLTFTATQGEVMATPQTRVSDYDDTDGKHKSKWTDGDQIEVKVSDNTGNTMGTTTCTLDENGNITAYNPQLYWQTTGNYTINAWYSNITGRNTTSTTVSLDNQSSGLAYVLKADQLTNKNYKSGNIALTFKHQLAKVRVKIVKGTYEGDLTNATVKMKGCYTSCTVSEGTVTAGSTTGDITMRKNGEYYEANLVPGTLQASEAFEIIADGKNTRANLQNEVSLQKGKVYEVTITVKQKVTEVNLNELTSTYTISQDGVYILTGSTTQRIVINANANVTLNGVTINTNNGGAPIQISGNHTATLILEDNNTLTSKVDKYPAILPEPGSTVEIAGTGSLKAQGAYSATGIGAGGSGRYFFEIINAGYIKISGGTIEAIGGGGATGIGCSYHGSCQGIEILGGTVTARAGAGYTTPAIGSFTAGTGVCEYVKLANCTINAYSSFADDTDPVVANSVTPSIKDSDALATAGVTLNVK